MAKRFSRSSKTDWKFVIILIGLLLLGLSILAVNNKMNTTSTNAQTQNQIQTQCKNELNICKDNCDNSAECKEMCNKDQYECRRYCRLGSTDQTECLTECNREASECKLSCSENIDKTCVADCNEEYKLCWAVKLGEVIGTPTQTKNSTQGSQK